MAEGMDEAELERIRKIEEVLQQEGWEDAIDAEDECSPPQDISPQDAAPAEEPSVQAEETIQAIPVENEPQPVAALDEPAAAETPSATAETLVVDVISPDLPRVVAREEETAAAPMLEPLTDVSNGLADSMQDVPLSESTGGETDSGAVTASTEDTALPIPPPAPSAEVGKPPRPQNQIPKVSITDNFVSGPNIMYQVHVEVGELDWNLARRYKSFEALHKKLAENAAAMEQERREGGAARTNIVLPKLPVKRTQLTALMSRAKTASSSEFAEELGAYLRHTVTACKGTPLLAVVTDWLDAPKHLAMLDQGSAGPLQHGAGGSFRIFMENKKEAPGPNAKEIAAELPTDIKWGEPIGNPPEGVPLDRLQLAVQELKTWNERPMDAVGVWFEFTTVAPEDRRQRVQVRHDEDCCLHVEGPYGEVEVTCWSSRMGSGWVGMSQASQSESDKRRSSNSAESAAKTNTAEAKTARRGLVGWTRLRLGDMFPERKDGLKQVWSRLWAPVPAYVAPDPPPPNELLYFIMPPLCVTEGEPFIFWAAQRIWSIPCPRVVVKDGERLPVLCILPNLSLTTSPLSVHVQASLTTSQAFKLHSLQREERAATHYRPLTTALCAGSMALTRSILSVSPPPAPFAAAMRVLVDEKCHFALLRRLVREDALASAAESSCAVTESVSVQLLRALGRDYVSNVIGALVQEICAAGRDLEIDSALSANPAEIDANADLLAELLSRFFAALLASVSPGHELACATTRRSGSALIGPPNAASLRLLKVIHEEMRAQVVPVVEPDLFVAQVFIGGYVARALRDPHAIITAPDTRTSIPHQAYRTLFWVGKAIEHCGGISLSLRDDGPQGVLAAAVDKYSGAIRSGLQRLVDQQALDRDQGVGGSGGGMGAASADLREVHKFIRREYRSIAADLGDDQRIAMEMELGDASGKLTWSEAAGVVRKEVEALWQLTLDLGKPLPREEERLLKATITIQRAVRLWQYVLVGSEEERMLDFASGASGWSIPSYTMVPDQAAVVFWHQSGRGCLCAESAWEVVQDLGVVCEKGRMPMLATQRSAVGLGGLRVCAGVNEGAVFVLRRNGDATVSLQTTNGDTLQRSRREETEEQRTGGDGQTKEGEEGRRASQADATPKGRGGIHLAMGLDFSLHGRFYLEYEPEGSQGFYSIREGCRRVGLSGGERKPEGHESGEGGGDEAEAAGLASPSVLKSGEGEAVTMLEGEGEWRWRVEVVSFPDLTAPREQRGGAFFGVRLQDGMRVALRAGEGSCVSVEGGASSNPTDGPDETQGALRLVLGSGDLIGSAQTLTLRRSMILPFSANVFALQTEVPPPPVTEAPKRSGMKAIFGGGSGTGSSKGSWREDKEKKGRFVAVAEDRSLTASALEISGRVLCIRYAKPGTDTGYAATNKRKKSYWGIRLPLKKAI